MPLFFCLVKLMWKGSVELLCLDITVHPIVFRPSVETAKAIGHRLVCYSALRLFAGFTRFQSSESTNWMTLLLSLEGDRAIISLDGSDDNPKNSRFKNNHGSSILFISYYCNYQNYANYRSFLYTPIRKIPVNSLCIYTII